MLIQDWKKVCKELQIIFGNKATDAVWSYMMSLEQMIKGLEKSRDMWKDRYKEVVNNENNNKNKL